MIIHSLTDIPYRKELAIIINVGTRFVSTLALLSTIKRAGMPVLLVDCSFQNSTEDYDFFKLLMNDYDFDLISLKLDNHGKTLDYLFRNLNSDYILLVDSDLEILDDNIVGLMRKYIQKQDVFGSGFLHGGLWLEKKVNWEENRDGYYEERMFIPFTLLNVNKIREALDKGITFDGRMIYNLLPFNQNLSRRILNSPKLNKLAFFRNYEYSIFNIFKKVYHKQKPLIILYDTGSDIYMYLRYQKSYFFAGVDANTTIESDFVKHYSGITRRLMFDDPYNTTSVDEEYLNIRERLSKEYLFDYENYMLKYARK
jgi:hypothetical protein